VLNDDGKLLLVQEAVGPLRGKDVWKIPTGLLEAGEDIADGCIRECQEETGIATEFVDLVAFRHAHGFMAGKSDIFFVCLLRAKSSSFMLQPGEISQAKWGDIDEFLEQAPYPRDSQLWSRLYRICQEASKRNHGGFTVKDVPIGFRPGTNKLYYPRNLVNEMS